MSNSEPLVVAPEQLDQHPWLLPVKNCVIDLRTGKSRPGNPDDYLTVAAPVEWKGLDEPAPHWEKYLSDTLNNNQEVIDFLLRALGYSITGLNTERLFVVLFGEHGNNGKGTLMEILFHVLGKLSSPIQSELLLAQKYGKSADGPSPAIMALKGLRLGWASETAANHSFASDKIKLYSGGDPLVGRGLNEKVTTFMPNHVLFLLTNNLPGAPAPDTSFWERIKVIDYPFSFVKRPPITDKEGNTTPAVLEKHQRLADPELLDNLKAEESGILASLVRGCLAWQQKGLSPPKKVIEDSQKYRRKQDDIQDFIEQCCHVNKADPNVKSPAGALYKKYKDWWEDVASTRPLSMKKFGDLMSMKFEKIKSSNVIYLGIMVDVTKSMEGKSA